MRISLLSVLLLCYNMIASAQDVDRNRLDQFFQTLESNNKFMGNVSVFCNGKEIYSKSVGLIDTDKGTVANKNSKYRIASISKTFTAVMVFQAIEAGKLSLSEPIDKYFPTIENGNKITIAHLLNHRSGIHNFTADEEYVDWHTNSKTREQMIDIITKGGSDFIPDSKNEYSNSNYVLLSYILESVHNKPYDKILADQITVPLSLTNTYLCKSTIEPERNECNSYIYFDKWRIGSVTNPSVTLGAGGIVSTPEELNQFAHALWGGKLVSNSSLSAMQILKDDCGMGLFPVPFYNKQGFGHSGGIDEFHSMLIFFPEDKLSYSITSNALNYAFNDIHLTVLSGVYGIPFDIPSFDAATLAPDDLDKYTGVYSSSQLPLKLTIRINGNSLEGQGTGQPSFPLAAVSEHTFKFAQGGIAMEFNSEKSTMILKQGGGVFYFKKE